MRNIWQAREIIDGKISFQVGPTVYRGLWIVDGAFLLEAATMVNKGEDARDGLEYMLSFQQPNGKFGKLRTDFWKENGIVLWACVRHAMLTQDKTWLKSIWPKLSKTVDFIKEMRKKYDDEETTIIKKILEEGAKRNIFYLTDLNNTTNAILTALKIAELPYLISEYIDNYDEMMDSLIDIVLYGIVKR